MLHFLLLPGVASALSLPLQASQSVLSDHTPAELPHQDPTHSFWVHSPGANPLAEEGSAGNLTDEADICIIGSGLTGVSAAYHLANAVEQGTFPVPAGEGQLRAVILEARDFCSGATGRNGGNLTPYEFQHFRKIEEQFGTEDALRQYAIEHYSATEMARIARESGWAGAVDLVEGGHMDIMLTETHLEQLQDDYAAAVAAGKTVDVTWFSKEEMNETYGTYNYGVRSPGYNIWPLKFATHLLKLANSTAPSQLDLRLHTHTPVTRVRPFASVDNASSSRRWTLATPRGPVHCTAVLHATNGYASHLLPHLAGPEGIIPVRGQVIALRAAASAEKLTKVSWVGDDGYWFPRPVQSHKSAANSTINQNADEKDDERNPLVILGGARIDAGPPFEIGTTDDSVLNTNVGETLRGFLPRLFPRFYEQGREPDQEWTGIMGYTKLNIPFIGPVITPSHPRSSGSRYSSPDTHAQTVTLKGQYIAAGYTGHGMPRTYACAEAVVGMIAHDIFGKEGEWEVPEWLPRAWLTTKRGLGE